MDYSLGVEVDEGCEEVFEDRFCGGKRERGGAEEFGEGEGFVGEDKDEAGGGVVEGGKEGDD